MQKETKYKEFALSSWAVDNNKTVYLITFLVFLWGLIAYTSMPKEAFPEIVIPEIYVSTPYPGYSPDMVEDKITRAFEKEIYTVKGVKKVSSQSVQGFSSIKVEFDYKVPISEGLRKVKDAVDKARAKKEFPRDLPMEPMIFEADMSQMPIVNINLSGDYSAEQLNDYAELLKDRIEELAEINKVDIRGVQKKELLIEIDPAQATARDVSFTDIENAVRSENVNISSGELLDQGIRRAININAELKDAKDFENIVVKQHQGQPIYLRDVARVKFTFADVSSFAREFKKPVVMLDVKKRSGENLLEASDKIRTLLRHIWSSGELPADLSYTLTNDLSRNTRGQVSNLENSIILGVLLVVGVLLFFMGLGNALFVGVAIPLSMLMSFMILRSLGITLNVMVLFSLVLALGMLVDNGIVVVENVYRWLDEGMDRISATKRAVGEVAYPIIASTATTLAAFIPLALWPGIMGEFMKYLPITLIIVLSSSLFVALVINPALAAYFMKPSSAQQAEKTKPSKKLWILVVLGLVFILIGWRTVGNLMVLFALFSYLNKVFLIPKSYAFQNKFLPKLENAYQKTLRFALKNKNPRRFTLGTFALLFVSFVLLGVFTPKVEFFPVNEPTYINVLIEMPMGTDIEQMNNITRQVENITEQVLGKYKDVYGINAKTQDTLRFVESMIAQVGQGASDPNDGVALNDTPNKARLTVSFSEFEYRNGVSTGEVMKELRHALVGVFPADIKIAVDKNRSGPPQEPPINIEVRGHAGSRYEDILDAADDLLGYIGQKNIAGIENLKMDIEISRPEMPLHIDREKARFLGLSTQQIAYHVRTALFGSQFSTYKQGKEVYDVNLRYQDEDRYNLNLLLDQKIVFRDQITGKLLSIPLSAVLETPKKTSSFSAVNRLNQQRLVRLKSQVSEGYNANEVVQNIKQTLSGYTMPDGFIYKFTGQQEEQAKEMKFLSTALLIAVFLVFLIIVMQFNSISTPLIIMSAVVLSLIGVLLGLVIFQRPFIIIMTMIGIISLAGVVVNNAIVLIDYTQVLVNKRKDELGLSSDEYLEESDMKACIVKGGTTRLRPVLLTAITTILGLIPMAVGININFLTWLSDYDANIYLGGENALFFGAMSEAIIYGLVFATFLTLVIVPVMYLLLYKLKRRLAKNG